MLNEVIHNAARLPFDGYVRVSRVGGRDKSDGFISPDVQRKAILAWAAQNNIEVVVHDADLDESGGTMDRPVFNNILQRIKAGKSAGIVVYKVDRFARSTVGALNTLAALGEYKAGFASCSEQVSYHSANDRLMLQFQFMLAEWVRNSLGESWQASTKHAIERGVHIANQLPFGYDLGRGRVYVQNEFAPEAKAIFIRRGRGEGWRSISTWLDFVAPLYRVDDERNLWLRPVDEDGEPVADEDLPNKRPVYRAYRPGSLSDDQEAGAQRVLWGVNRVQRHIHKRVYLGEAYYGEQVNQKAHEPLVTRAEWDRAHKAKGESLPRNPGKVPNLLQGLIRCTACRYSMAEGRGRAAIRTYRCNNRKVAGRCPAAAYIVADNVETYVAELFKSHLRSVGGRLVPLSTDLECATRELTEARAELDAFLADTASRARLRRVGRLEAAEEAWVQAVETAERRVEELEAALNPDLGVDIRNWGFDVDVWWDEVDQPTRQRALSAAIDCIFVRGPKDAPLERRVLVQWRGQGPKDLPRRGRENGGIRPFVWPDQRGER